MIEAMGLVLWLASVSPVGNPSPADGLAVDTVEALEEPRPVADEVSATSADSGDEVERRPNREPRVRTDVARVVGATLLYSALYPDVRGPLTSDGSLSQVGRHLRRPIRSAIEGAREDDDPFFTNYVAHPLSWGAIGYYFRSRGHSPLSSLLMSQGHSLFWEYFLEGTYQKPSGKDLLTNLTSAWVGILLAGSGEEGGSSVRIDLRPGLGDPRSSRFTPLSADRRRSASSVALRLRFLH